GQRDEIAVLVADSNRASDGGFRAEPGSVGAEFHGDEHRDLQRKRGSSRIAGPVVLGRTDADPDIRIDTETPMLTELVERQVEPGRHTPMENEQRAIVIDSRPLSRFVDLVEEPVDSEVGTGKILP